MEEGKLENEMGVEVKEFSSNRLLDVMPPPQLTSNYPLKASTESLMVPHNTSNIDLQECISVVNSCVNPVGITTAQTTRNLG
eukprot:scaffold6164_cov89-Skeletonema_dohrnii-CCMP3373.AAC.7